MAGLLGNIFSTIDTQKRKLTDLLGNPVESLQQIVGNVNDRARNLNQLTAAAAQEKDLYGPKSQQLASLLADAYNPIGMMVYHGSPAKFSKFDPTKIGSGEGAQAYGYGHYVAESPDVAQSYQASVTNSANANFLHKGKPIDPNNELQRSAAFNLMAAKGDKEAIYKQWKPSYWETSSGKKFKREIEKLDYSKLEPAGSLYEIDLPDEQIAKMLDFDKPLMQQSKEIQNLAKQYGLTDADHMGGDLIAAMDAKRAAGAEAMRQAGVPGIRYLDQGSRGTGEGTSNFVVFPGNEDLLTILKRNGGLLGP